MTGDGMKTYVLELYNGNLRRITVPAKWKVTFGPAVPGKPGQTGGQERHYALRFYETKDRQRAVFTDVRTFRDDSISIEERVSTTKRQVVRKQTASGVKDVEVAAVMTEWINPDNPPPPGDEFLRLEHRDSDF
jgi:hypothetical protein